MSNSELLISIIEGLGGVQNIESVTSCLTRIRFELKNKEMANIDSIRSIYGVNGAIIFGNQIQVVLGDKTKDIMEMLNEKIKIF